MYLFVSDYRFICKQYKKKFGYKLNLKDPKTFTEKINWKKIYDHNPLYTYCTDKFLVRNYVTEKIGPEYLIPLIQVVDRAKDVCFDKLPESFIVKANHGCCWNKIVFDKNKLNDKDKASIIKLCNCWLKKNYYIWGREHQYKYIKPKIIVEKLLLDECGGLPEDYKFFCFNGNVEFFTVEIDRFENHTRKIFDKNWNELNFSLGDLEIYKGQIERPINLDMMLKIVTKLSENFSFVRVDLYNVRNKIYFGELTFTPNNGHGKFYPSIYDFFYGQKLII
jgi:hypothetical protein